MVFDGGAHGADHIVIQHFDDAEHGVEKRLTGPRRRRVDRLGEVLDCVPTDGDAQVVAEDDTVGAVWLRVPHQLVRGGDNGVQLGRGRLGDVVADEGLQLSMVLPRRSDGSASVELVPLPAPIRISRVATRGLRATLDGASTTGLAFGREARKKGVRRPAFGNVLLVDTQQHRHECQSVRLCCLHFLHPGFHWANDAG